MAKKGGQQKTYNHPLPPGGRVGDPIIHGNVSTEIYANLRSWGEVVFKIRQQRILPAGYDKSHGEWFTSEDLSDMMRGAYEAQRRIKKRRRRLLWRGIFMAP